ncbi:MAG: hypothetical protein ACXWTL_10850, partial [Methylobacter sp.]
MFEGLPSIFLLFIYLYIIMKKPKTPTEKPVPKAETEQLAATVPTEAKPKKSSPTPKAPKKSP